MNAGDTRSGTASPRGNLIGGVWHALPGEAMRSFNPARPAQRIWHGTPRVDAVDRAVASAAAAGAEWAAWPFDKRADALRKFRDLATANVEALASLISDEVGKPLWDAKAEAQLLAAKVDITLEQPQAIGSPLARVSSFSVDAGAGRTGRCWFKPHGVMAVIGPFNFPAHLPNGHIVPALAMGNTIVFKPSDKAPAVGEFLAHLLHEALTQAGAPAGVINLVQGGADVAGSLAAHKDVHGVLFTGSWPVGRRIMEANLDRPGKMLALEMGGNNAAVVMPDSNLRQAVIECVRSAFVTAGQRCTCTRRLIVHRQVADHVIPAILKAAKELSVGDPRSKQPMFMGPLVSEQARAVVLDAQAQMINAGGRALLACAPSDGGTGGWYISPGVIEVPEFVEHTDVRIHPGADVEVFGPLLRMSIVDSLDDAIHQANATAFGLAASIFTADSVAAGRFQREVHAGCINWNTGTAGASSKLPFGGLGLSGNHRPAGAFSLDYCAYPVAGMHEPGAAATLAPGMVFDDQWLA